MTDIDRFRRNRGFSLAELFIIYTYRPTSLNAENIRRFLRPIKKIAIAILGAKNVGEGS